MPKVRKPKVKLREPYKIKGRQCTVYIYALCCPLTFLPKYVGQTKNIRGRYNDHLAEKAGYNYQNVKKQKWIAGLMEKNLKPYFTILEITNSNLCNEREQHWTIKYFNEGHLLFNKKIGLFSPDKFKDLKLSNHFT